MKNLKFWTNIVADDYFALFINCSLVLIGNVITSSKYAEYFFLMSILFHKSLVFNSLNKAKLLWFTTPIDPRLVFLSKNSIVLLNAVLMCILLDVFTLISINICIKYVLNLGFCLIFGNFISNYWANSQRRWQTSLLIIISYSLSGFLVHLSEIFLTGNAFLIAFLVMISGLIYSILKQTNFENKYFLIEKLLRNDKNQ